MEEKIIGGDIKIKGLIFSIFKKMGRFDVNILCDILNIRRNSDAVGYLGLYFLEYLGYYNPITKKYDLSVIRYELERMDRTYDLNYYNTVFNYELLSVDFEHPDDIDGLTIEILLDGIFGKAVTLDSIMKQDPEDSLLETIHDIIINDINRFLQNKYGLYCLRLIMFTKSTL